MDSLLMQRVMRAVGWGGILRKAFVCILSV